MEKIYFEKKNPRFFLKNRKNLRFFWTKSQFLKKWFFEISKFSIKNHWFFFFKINFLHEKILFLCSVFFLINRWSSAFQRHQLELLGVSESETAAAWGLGFANSERFLLSKARWGGFGWIWAPKLDFSIVDPLRTLTNRSTLGVRHCFCAFLLVLGWL